MGDTGSEGSEPPGNINAIPPRCPCGFWGSSKTMNLCSKCFADVQKKPPEDDVEDGEGCSPKNSLTCSQTVMYCNETGGGGGGGGQPPGTTGALLPAPSVPPQAESPGSDLLPKKRARLKVPEDEESPSPSPCGVSKRRRRCRVCSTKLELVQQEMGSCRCGFIFCSLHRLPEQHGCPFDHLGHGRQEAVQKVVKLRRKVGRSCQRIGEEFS